MTEYNAADLKQIRAAKRAAKLAEESRKTIVAQIMGSPIGRAYMHDRLLRCHVFATTFTDSARVSAFAEGERNIGLQDLNDVMKFCPDQYVQMMREANEKEIANDRSSDNQRGRNGDATGLSDGTVTSDYDPFDSSGDNDDSDYDPSARDAVDPRDRVPFVTK